MNRRGFTLIELLAVVAIMGAMVAVAVVSLGAGKGSMRLAGATRDVMAMLRRARSVALVTQKPVMVTYSNGKTEDGEALAQVTVKSEKLFSSPTKPRPVETLSGEPFGNPEDAETAGDMEGGETLEEILSPEAVPQDVGRGMKIKILNENEELTVRREVKRSSVSIFSTVDNLSRTYTSGPSAAETAAAEEQQATEAAVTVIFAANGTVDPPHKIWIYPETATPDRGLCIEIDRFGEPRCREKEER